jgi:hypothetical protein
MEAIYQIMSEHYIQKQHNELKIKASIEKTAKSSCYCR